jgi:translation elongation factor EF-1alpha
MEKEKQFIENYKKTSFLPSLNFEGDLMVSEDELARMLKMYAEDSILHVMEWYRMKTVMSNFNILMSVEKALEMYTKEHSI